MKQYVKKIVIVFSATVFFLLMTFIQPVQKASANPLAVGGALYMGGAGIYVVGVLGASAVAGLIELDSCPSCQEDLENHAKNVWAGATQTAKDGLQLMIDGSVGLGNSLAGIDSNVNSWLGTKIDEIALHYTGLKIGTAMYGVRSGMEYRNESCNSGRCLTLLSDNGAMNTKQWIINGQHVPHAGVNIGPYTKRVTYSTKNSDGTFKTTQIDISQKFTADQFTQFQNQMIAANSFEKVYALFAAVGYGVISATDSTYQTFNSAKASATETWEEMTDAGLVLPTDQARPVHNGQPVTYDPTTDSYAGIDGVNVPREEITFQYPKPHYKTNDDLAALGIGGAGAGLYIDGWVGTDTVTSSYDSTTDTTTTTTTTEIPHTNVTTGETVTSTTTTTTTTPGDTTGNPPPSEGGGSTTPKINFKPLVLLGLALTEKFPFSIPWDVFDLFSQFNVEPISPIFEIGSGKDIYLGDMRIPVKYDFDIDFSKFDPLAMIIRWGEILVFDICLIMALRRLTPD